MLNKKIQKKKGKAEAKNTDPNKDSVFMDMQKVLDDSKKSEKEKKYISGEKEKNKQLKKKEIENSALKKILDHLNRDLEK